MAVTNFNISSKEQQQAYIDNWMKHAKRTYRNMVYRCDNSKYYTNVSVCEEWLTNPESFLIWLVHNEWEPSLVVARIGDTGDYSPDNCRITTKADNAKEARSKSYKISTLDGETFSIFNLAEFCRKWHISYARLQYYIGSEKLVLPYEQAEFEHTYAIAPFKISRLGE